VLSSPALRTEAETLGIQIRAGIHTGECELLDTDIGGLAVHIAARILGQASAREILVSRTVRDLVVGSGTGFEDRGPVELRGVPGTWQLLADRRHGPRAGSPEADWRQCPRIVVTGYLDLTDPVGDPCRHESRDQSRSVAACGSS